MVCEHQEAKDKNCCMLAARKNDHSPFVVSQCKCDHIPISRTDTAPGNTPQADLVRIGSGPWMWFEPDSNSAFKWDLVWMRSGNPIRIPH